MHGQTGSYSRTSRAIPSFAIVVLFLPISIRLGLGIGFWPTFLALLFLAVYAIKDLWWFEPWPLGLTLIVTHLGLLIWETRYVSASLAYPGLKPAKSR